MEKLRVFCFGFGQVAKCFIENMISKNISFELNSTSRKKTELKSLSNINYKSFHFDEDKFDKVLIEKLESSDHILISVPPLGNEDLVLKNFHKNFKKLNAKWITYLSATSVYGNHDGAWVDENSLTQPTSLSGIARLKAEKSWVDFGKNENLPIQILRLSGIYSNRFNVLKRLKTGDIKIINKKNHYFSRIHVDDIANILIKSFKKIKGGEIFNVSDDKPASNEDVVMYGVKLLNLKKPDVIEVQQIESEMLKNFYKDSKKVDNKKMKTFFNYSLKFPTYVEGLNHIFDNNI